ncbi:helix-turn-helix transcriptional regulator [Thermoactinomyces sp. CICC 10522]|jgi:putative transcriptional regulator|uniref:helix-turn-helix transcriptional regulator n=1 Tax=Thermoactinomyces sp. CICC 10522 TaxID=2767427 RepID=UPI0018DECC43|nr:helix-turn-helix transcriptional regulator [Thermoactinomyces sp. CICC 10522]MBH8605551.1 helix-turn-helix transcriptional regulator [Thermoactinomyces sp. CICC 10522]
MTLNKKGKLRNRIMVLRTEKGWTQKELAEKVGVTRQTIISLERNKYSPSLVLAFELARVFGRDINDVFQYSIFEEESDDI